VLTSDKGVLANPVQRNPQHPTPLIIPHDMDSGGSLQPGWLIFVTRSEGELARGKYSAGSASSR
jgi:hypothetical protein